MSRNHAIRLAFAALAIAFFATPIAARMIGITAESFENRPFATAPTLSQGWDAFGQTTRFLVDRMPLRKQAIEANTRIWTDIFDTDPRYATGPGRDSDQALPFAGEIERDDRGANPGGDGGDLQGTANASTGREGWVFLSEEFSFACRTRISNAALLARWAALVAAVRATGRHSVMFAAPHKASVYPEHLPDKYPYDHCALAEKNRLWRAIAHYKRERGVIGLRDVLLRMKRTEGDELFELTDMHWTTLGALALVDATLEAVDGGVELKSDEIVDRGLVPYEGDLDVVRGKREETMHREYAIERAPGAARVPGRTLLLCDSFAYKWMRLFKPYFEDLGYVSLYHTEEEMLPAIERADRVVFVANEIFLKVQAENGEFVPTLTEMLKDVPSRVPSPSPHS